MEIKIGVQHVARELSVETDAAPEEILAELNKCVEDGGVLTLTDAKGHTIAVPADKVAYLDFTADKGRKVGFGLGSA